MRAKSWCWAAGLLTLSLLGEILALPIAVSAKVFLYALTRDGDLVKYDPDANQILEVRPGVGRGHIDRRNPDSDGLRPTRVLDVARRRIVTFSEKDPGVVQLDLRTGTATEIAVASPQPEFELKHLVYPRLASRFYVQWVRPPNPTHPAGPLLTAVGLDGRILATTPSMIAKSFSGTIAHPDGRTFYVLNEPNELLRVDGETLAIRETYALGAFYRPRATGHGIADVRDGRALLNEGDGTRADFFEPRILFTVDLATQTASPRITTGLGASYVRLDPGGRVIILQEARTAHARAGAGRLHFYDVVTGNKLGMVSFDANMGAVFLGFHPDGRRLFVLARDADSSTGEVVSRLVIVDVGARAIARNREFEDIGLAVDFVDEP